MQYLQRIQSCGKRSVKHAAADLYVSEIIGSTDAFDNRGRAERAVLQVSFRRTFAVFAELHQCMAGRERTVLDDQRASAQYGRLGVSGDSAGAGYGERGIGGNADCGAAACRKRMPVEIQNCGIGIIGKREIDAFGDIRKQCDGRTVVVDMLDCRLQAGICVVADLCHG